MLYELLLEGLDDCRWNYLRGLADAAEDEGKHELARGWRWMADHHKWPLGWQYGYLFEVNAAPLKRMTEYGLPLVIYVAVKEALDAKEAGMEDNDLQLRNWGGRDGLAKFMSVVAEAIGKRLVNPRPRRSFREGRQP
jgi:hypothetical protein